ncbi:MAG: hypothetical protein R3240_06535 [Gammaproteobacteria bacterium]|nr:hypothetical protein [Gammaproteobacteria bacterium]
MESKLKKMLIVLLVLLISSCATFHKIEGVSDFSAIELQQDDTVHITTKEGETVNMIVEKTDADYLYGTTEGVVVKKADIESMELSRSYPGKYFFAFIGLMMFSFFFSG